MQNKTLMNALLALGCLGILGGIYSVYEFLVMGLEPTALGSSVTWGARKVAYIYFLGLSGGSLLIALLTVVMRKKQFEAFSGVAAWAVLAAEMSATIAVTMELGRWEHIYHFVLSPNLESPMAWVFIFLMCLIVVYGLKILALSRGQSARAHILTLWSIPVSLLFYASNGYIFGMLTAQPLWGGAFTPLWFVLAALVSGGGLVGILGWAAGFNDELMQDYGRILVSLIVAFVFFEAFYLIYAAQGGDAETAQALNTLLWGSGSLVFWLGHAALGIALPLVILAGAKTASRVGVGALVLTLTFSAARWFFLIPVQSVEPIPGLTAAFHHSRLDYVYSASSSEWLAVLFLFSLCLVTLLMGPRIVPALFSKQGERHV